MQKKVTSALSIASLIFFLIIGIELFILYSINHTLEGRKSTVNTSFPVNTPVAKEPGMGKKLPPPKMTIDPTKKYEALMKTTVGSIQIELYADKTPITVNNFIYLARNNFYQNIEFHRVIKDFFIQTGDPTGTGTGNPGYTIKDERFEGEYVKGMVAMANTDRANSSGSQFFIMHGNVPIEKTYPIFGKVIKGLEIIDKIANAPVKPEGDASSPVNPVKILSISITEK